jgi:hypothetical protein
VRAKKRAEGPFLAEPPDFFPAGSLEREGGRHPEDEPSRRVLREVAFPDSADGGDPRSGLGVGRVGEDEAERFPRREWDADDIANKDLAPNGAAGGPEDGVAVFAEYLRRPGACLDPYDPCRRIFDICQGWENLQPFLPG